VSHSENRMTAAEESDTHFDLYVLRDFLGKQTCEEIVAEMRLTQGGLATVYGRDSSGSVDERVRRVMRQTVAPETVEAVKRRLLECKGEIEEHFSVKLSSCDEPQFLRYRVGDFFVAHQDGNTRMLRLDQEARRVSVVIFLSREAEVSEEGAHSGGSLVFLDWGSGHGSEKFHLTGEAGTLVAFRSEITHEVTPVTHGERHSIACWYR
jgi:SM-20-related protein